MCSFLLKSIGCVQNKTTLTSALLGWISFLAICQRSVNQLVLLSYSSSEMAIAWLLKLNSKEEHLYWWVSGQKGFSWNLFIQSKTHKHSDEAKASVVFFGVVPPDALFKIRKCCCYTTSHETNMPKITTCRGSLKDCSRRQKPGNSVHI